MVVSDPMSLPGKDKASPVPFREKVANLFLQHNTEMNIKETKQRGVTERMLLDHTFTIGIAPDRNQGTKFIFPSKPVHLHEESYIRE